MIIFADGLFIFGMLASVFLMIFGFLVILSMLTLLYSIEIENKIKVKLVIHVVLMIVPAFIIRAIVGGLMPADALLAAMPLILLLVVSMDKYLRKYAEKKYKKLALLSEKDSEKLTEK